MNDKVDGKKIISDVAALAKDLGVYILYLGKRIYVALRSALAGSETPCETAAAPE